MEYAHMDVAILSNSRIIAVEIFNVMVVVWCAKDHMQGWPHNIMYVQNDIETCHITAPVNETDLTNSCPAASFQLIFFKIPNENPEKFHPCVPCRGVSVVRTCVTHTYSPTLPSVWKTHNSTVVKSLDPYGKKIGGIYPKRWRRRRTPVTQLLLFLR